MPIKKRPRKTWRSSSRPTRSKSFATSHIWRNALRGELRRDRRERWTTRRKIDFMWAMVILTLMILKISNRTLRTTFCPSSSWVKRILSPSWCCTKSQKVKKKTVLSRPSLNLLMRFFIVFDGRQTLFNHRILFRLLLHPPISTLYRCFYFLYNFVTSLMIFLRTERLPRFLSPSHRWNRAPSKSQRMISFIPCCELFSFPILFLLQILLVLTI